MRQGMQTDTEPARCAAPSARPAQRPRCRRASPGLCPAALCRICSPVSVAALCLSPWAAGAGCGAKASIGQGRPARSPPPAPPRPRRDPRPAASALRPLGAAGRGAAGPGGVRPKSLRIPVPVRGSAPLARPGAACPVLLSTCTGRTWRTAATPRGCSRTTPSAPGPLPR